MYVPSNIIKTDDIWIKITHWSQLFIAIIVTLNDTIILEKLDRREIRIVADTLIRRKAFSPTETARNLRFHSHAQPEFPNLNQARHFTPF
jgi:hypothetical protein